MSTVSDYNAYSNSLQRLKDSYESDLSRSRSESEKEIEKIKKEYEGEITQRKAEYQESMGEERSSAREEIRKLKEELYDSNGKRSAKEMKERLDDRARLQEYREAVETDASRKVEHVTKFAESRMEKMEQENAKKIEGALRAERRSHREETKPLHEELAQFRSEGRDVATEKANARQEMIRTFEDDHLRERDYIVGSYETLMERMKEKSEEEKDLHSRRLNATQLESNGRTRKLLGAQKAEFKQTLANERTRHQVEVSDQERQMRLQQDRFDRGQKQLVENHAQDMGRALEEKDKAYTGYLERSSKEVRAELKAREDLIRDLQTTTDPRRVSPQLVRRMQEREEVRHHQKLEQAMGLDRARLEAVRARDHEERAELREHYHENLRAMHQGHQKAEDQRSRLFLDAVHDMQNNQESQARTWEDRSKHAVSKLHSDHQRESIETSRRHREALIEQRDSLQEQNARVAQEKDFERKIQDREWMIRLNDQRKVYERKMEVDRDQHEQQVAELRSDYESRIRDLERTARRITEEKDRNLEQVVKQQELSFKEKERFLVEHYEEELDKMKRTNAHLIAKKS
jgi:hypothetical protein